MRLKAKLVAAAAGALVVAVFGITPGAARAGTGASCQTYTVTNIALGAGQPAIYEITGELCATASELRSGETVQLLVPGATYNHRYWDFTDPRDPGSSFYSYARQEADLGYPAFAVDMIGTGDSSVPVSTLLTYSAAAFTIHQVIQGLRDGTATGISFGKVIEVGHSAGSDTVWLEASTYHDVNGVIITGAKHHFTQFAQQSAQSLVVPANSLGIPRFAGLDPGYLTTPTEAARETAFYNSADADEAVVDQDEATKDVVSGTFDQTAAAGANPAVSQAITVPVLVVMGQKDAFFCDGTSPCDSGAQIVHEEQADYSPQACLQAVSVPLSGHDISLHLDNAVQSIAALSWSNEFIGQLGGPPPPGCPRS